METGIDRASRLQLSAVRVSSSTDPSVMTGKLQSFSELLHYVIFLYLYHKPIIINNIKLLMRE